MTPNSSPVPGPRAPSRRSFLAAATVAAAAAAGGASFLTACGSSGSGKREGATSDKAAKKLLPAFVASSVAEPDIPAKNGSAAKFTSKVDPDALTTSVPDKLGTGAPLKIMSPLWGAAPKGNCAYYTQLDKIAGTDITWQNQDGNTYGEKLGAAPQGSWAARCGT